MRARSWMIGVVALLVGAAAALAAPDEDVPEEDEPEADAVGEPAEDDEGDEDEPSTSVAKPKSNAKAPKNAKPAPKRNANQRPPDLERGRELFVRHCQACHGATLAGDGPAAEALVAKVPDIRDQITGDGENYVMLVLQGNNAMPGFEESFDKHDARRVLQFIRNLDAGTLPEQYRLEGGEEPQDDDAVEEEEE